MSAAGERILIVNADDFGRNEDVNEGVVLAHRAGIVTSASLMVRWPAAAAGVRACPDLDLGLHLDLGEWIRSAGSWSPTYEVSDVNDAEAVETEVRRQVEMFAALTGREPTHLDSHQHVHTHEPVRSILLRLATRLGVPLRHVTPTVRYCGTFYGRDERGQPQPEAISAESLIRIVGALEPGVTELCCHPARTGVGLAGYSTERRLELSALCDDRVRAALGELGVRLASFAEMPALMP